MYLNVLVACEKSAAVRDAFNRAGHNAWSCDVERSSGRHANHLHGDVRWALEGRLNRFDAIDMRTGNRPMFIKWDLMIAHPPCTRLCNSGVLRLYVGGKKANGPDELKWAEMRAAAAFYRDLRDADIPRKGLENPIMHGYARDLINLGHVQTVQPHQFGEDASKATRLELINLPDLVPTCHVAPRMVNGRPRWANQTDSGQNKLPPSKDRADLRSATYPGIAQAMADQWGKLQPI